jgi:TonB family protein
VTFGFLSPIVLLPESFLKLGHEEQRAIACHELLHVRRKDWLVTLVEEFIAVLFWFHPAIWWLLAQTRLAREQLVDAQVVRLTQAREPYIDALLAMAGSRPQLDLAPAPLFLRRRHLIQRMHSLLSEVSMSTARLVSSYALMAVILAAAAWAALVSFPLFGEAQVRVRVPDGVAEVSAPGPTDPPGITVNAGGNLVRRGPIIYPADAHRNRIEGAVFAELTVNRSGEVTDARILSGPDELRKAVLQSVLQWRYAPDSAPSGTVVASVDFRATAGSAPPVLMGPSTGFSYTASSVGSMPAGLRGTVMFPALFQGVLAPIDVSDVPEPVRSRLAERLRQFQGQRVTPSLLGQIDEAAKETIPSGTQRTMRYGLAENKTDTRLGITTQPNEAVATASISRNIQTPFGQRGTAPGVATPFGVQPPGGVATPFGTAVATPSSPTRVRVGASVAAANLIVQVKPEYPQPAREAKIQGVVVLEAVIGSDGKVANLQVIAGHPLLTGAAINAVKQWVYQPVLLNDQAVEAITTVTVNFSLQQQ